MLGQGSQDYCETCFYKAKTDHFLNMAAASMDDGKRRELKKAGFSLIDELDAADPVQSWESQLTEPPSEDLPE